MLSTITTKTLVPISIAGAIGMGSFYFSASNSKIDTNFSKIQRNESIMMDHIKETNKNYIEIIQRLTRIEEAIKE